jgi:hypothetical protein
MGQPAAAQVSTDSILEDFSHKHCGYGVTIETETVSGERYTTIKDARLVSVASTTQGMVTIAVKDRTGAQRNYTITGNWRLSGMQPHAIELSDARGRTTVRCLRRPRARKQS